MRTACLLLTGATTRTSSRPLILVVVELLCFLLAAKTSDAFSSPTTKKKYEIPPRLQPPSGVLVAASTDAWKSPDGPRFMNPIDFGLSENVVQTLPPISVKEMISNHIPKLAAFADNIDSRSNSNNNAVGSIAFVVRRPG